MTVIDPEVGWEPDQAPLPVHAVAFWVLHVSVELCPGITAPGFKEMLMIAGGPGWVNTAGVLTTLLHPARTKERIVKHAMSKDRKVLGE